MGHRSGLNVKDLSWLCSGRRQRSLRSLCIDVVSREERRDDRVFCNITEKCQSHVGWPIFGIGKVRRLGVHLHTHKRWINYHMLETQKRPKGNGKSSLERLTDMWPLVNAKMAEPRIQFSGKATERKMEPAILNKTRIVKTAASKSHKRILFAANSQETLDTPIKKVRKISRALQGPIYLKFRETERGKKWPRTHLIFRP